MPLFGKVKWFDNRKGYGFIEKEDGSGDVFAHFQEIVGEGYRTLNEGDRVKFEIINTPKGDKATKIERVDSAPPAAPPEAQPETPPETPPETK